MMIDLHDKHALVTGGGSGVGAAIATALVQAGARVTITGRNQAALDALAERYPQMLARCCDVSDRASMERAIDDVTQRHGGIDIAVANAGIAASSPFLKVREADLGQMLDVNLNGVFNTWQLCIPAMLTAGRGRLIAIASMAGLQGYAYTAAYCASKHATIGLMRSVAMEFARKGITANAVCPGFVDTPMLERSIDNIVALTGRSRAEARESLASQNRDGQIVSVQQVASLVLELAADEAGARNGEAVEL